MPSKYLVQRATGRLYLYTPTLFARGDMSEYDPSLAEARIAALQKRLADLEAKKLEVPDKVDEVMVQAKADAKTIGNLELAVADREKDILKEKTGLDPGGPSDEDIEKERVEKLIAEDPQISKIHNMTKKDEVKAYALEEFGQEVDGSLKEMKLIVVDLRTKRLLEK